MRRLLGDDAVTQRDDRVEICVPTGQRIILSESEEQRLEKLTLRVSSLATVATVFSDNDVAFARPSDNEIGVAPDDACGAALCFTESPSG